MKTMPAVRSQWTVQVARSLGCVIVFVSLWATASAGSILVDDFNDGDDDGWTRTDSNDGQPWGPGIFDASSAAYQLMTTGVVPSDAPGRGFLASFWDESSDPIYSNGFVRAKVQVNTLRGVGAILFRYSGDLTSGFDGYAFVGLAGSGFVFNRIESTSLSRVVEVPGEIMGVGEEWWMEGGAVGDQISMKVWRVGEPEPTVPQLTLTDSSFTDGVFGVDANMEFGDPTAGIVNTIFDNVFFTPIPEPSSLLLALSGVLLLLRRRTHRSETTVNGGRILRAARHESAEWISHGLNWGVKELRSYVVLTLLAFATLCVNISHAVDFEWAHIGNPGNPPDDTGWGAVDHHYHISKHEVTNLQYTEFLNAVDPTGRDPLALYNSFMSSDANGGINFNENASEGFKYEVKSGRATNPVTYVSFLDAMRFVNWLENGQGVGNTESGVYSINDGTTEHRDVQASYFLPSTSEWYKAAFHKNDGITANYWAYPTSSDEHIYSDDPNRLNTPDNTNVANVFFLDDPLDDGFHDGFAVTGSFERDDTQNYLTDVGAYSLASSPYGTFDQAGNVWEWLEAINPRSAVAAREIRGGGWYTLSLDSGYTARRRQIFLDPVEEHPNLGFRVASVPEPTTLALASIAAAAVTMLSRRRKGHQ